LLNLSDISFGERIMGNLLNFFGSKHKSKWDEWPKWSSDEKQFRTQRFNFSCSVTDYSDTTDAKHIALLKDKGFLAQYRELFEKDQPKNIFEIGFFQGGMPLFLADMTAPKKIVAIDWYAPNEDLLNIINSNNLSKIIELVGNVDQADTARIRAILDEKFGNNPIDLIIDDCSHYYQQTKACFEALFGYLRPGGKYIIEDWGWTHWPGTPWQTAESHFNGMESMSNLIFELVMAMGSDHDKIKGINIINHACVIVTKGPNVGYKEPIDLRGMTNLADKRSADLIKNTKKA